MPDHIDLSANHIHARLTFDEANIVLMNIRPEHNANSISFPEFQYRLENLLRHTPDSCLAGSIRSLQEKIRFMSNREFEQLYRDSMTGKIMSPENYQLPSF